MTPIKLETPGSGSVSKSPDVAVLSIDIRSQSTDQTKPTWDIQQTSGAIQEELKGLAKKSSDGLPAPDAAVLGYRASSMSTRSWIEGSSHHSHCHHHNSQHPYHHQHHLSVFKKEEKLFEASMRITAEYADFEKLAKATAKLASMPFVSVAGVRWELLAENRAQARNQAIANACKDALTGARAWADGMGLGEVRVTRIVDTAESAGYGDGTDKDEPCVEVGNAAGTSVCPNRANGESMLTFAPKDIKVNATCQVHFEMS